MSVNEETREIRRRSWRDIDLRAVAPFAALALLLIVGALVNPNFIGITNLANVATRSAFIAIIAVGATFVISSGDLDLSVGSMVAFVASLMILLHEFRRHCQSGADAVVRGGLHDRRRRALRSCQRPDHHRRQDRALHRHARHDGHLSRPDDLAVAGRRDHVALAEQQALYRPVYFGSIAGVPVPIVVILAVTAVAAFILYRTRYGRHVVAVGSNSDVARYSGIAVNACRTIAFVIQGSASPLPCCSTCRVSGRPRRPPASCGNCRRSPPSSSAAPRSRGAGRVWGTICGAFILELVGNIMLLSNFISEYLIGAIQGAIIIIAMLVQRSLARKS
jgi:ribose transport system permease protein